MLLITCHTLASLGVNLYGCRLRSKEQEVRNGLQSLAFPSYRSGVPTHGTEIILGSGRIEAEDSSVGTVNERGWVDISCCNWAKRDVKASALGFCRKFGMCSSLLNWLSVLLGHIFNSLGPILWRWRCAESMSGQIVLWCCITLCRNSIATEKLSTKGKSSKVYRNSGKQTNISKTQLHTASSRLAGVWYQNDDSTGRQSTEERAAWKSITGQSLRNGLTGIRDAEAEILVDRRLWWL